MMKTTVTNTQVKVSVDPEIASSFKKACVSSNISMAAVLSQFMADYSKSLVKQKGKPDYSTRRRRRSAIKKIIEQLEEMKDDLIEVLDLPPDTTTEQLVEEIKEVIEELEAADETVVDVTANELAGGKKLQNADGTEIDNPMYAYAKKELKGLRGKKLNTAVEKLKTDPVMTALRSKQADPQSSVVTNVIKPAGIFREV